MAEALRLADELEAPLGTIIGAELYRRAAAELRRLYQINSDLCRKTNAQTIQSAREAEKVAVIETQRDALLEACKVALGIIGFGAEHDQISAAIKAVEGEKT